MKDKKSQGLSINMIVAAALALIILVVIIVIFKEKSGTFAEQINNCESKGGKCVKESECGIGKLYICENEGEVCCLDNCEAKGGNCKTNCDNNEEKLYFVNCENKNVCCKT